MSVLRLFAFLSVFCMLGSIADAHTRSQSSSSWRINGAEQTMTFSVDAYRATLLSAFGWDELSPEQMLARHLPETISVFQGAKECSMTLSKPEKAPRGELRHYMAFKCAVSITERPIDISIGSFFALSATHQHIFQARLDGKHVIERVLTDGKMSVLVSPSSVGGGFPSLLTLGFEHVVSGFDHILFLIALVLISKNWRHTVALITCFTAGHMIALYLVATGKVSPMPSVVEALIGLSIVAVAVAALARTQPLPLAAPYVVSGLFGVGGLVLAYADRLPSNWIIYSALTVFIFLELFRHTKGKSENLLNTMTITVLFSLAHGAGFAGGLIDANFQQSSLLFSILFFNVGVEIGQVAVAGGTFAVFSLINRFSSPIFFQGSEKTVSFILIWAGSYYFFVRLI